MGERRERNQTAIRVKFMFELMMNSSTFKILIESRIECFMERILFDLVMTSNTFYTLFLEG